MCLPTAFALPLHSCGDFGSPRVIGSSARCYKSAMTIKSIEASFAGGQVSAALYQSLTPHTPQ
jgi:hypothetical protein